MTVVNLWSNDAELDVSVGAMAARLESQWSIRNAITLRSQQAQLALQRTQAFSAWLACQRIEKLIPELAQPSDMPSLLAALVAETSAVFAAQELKGVTDESDENVETRMARLWQDCERAPRGIDCQGQLVDALEILSGWVMKRSCCDRCT